MGIKRVGSRRTGYPSDRVNESTVTDPEIPDSETELIRGIAVVCGHDGIVRSVLSDEIGLTVGNPVGRRLAELVDESSSDKATHFLASAVATGAAFDWELGIRSGRTLTLYHFAAAATSPDEVTVVAASTRTAVLRYYDELMRINNEQANALRSALKIRSSDAPSQDVEVYDRMMQLNNELSTVQRELTRKNLELQRSNRFKNQFVGMAAHDLRSPIGAIRSFSSLLLDDEIPVPPAQAREFLERIHTSSEFMLALINDLLDISTIESGHLILDAKEIDCVSIVRSNVELHRLLAEEKRISMTLEIRGVVPKITADARKLEQVLQNLLGNAVKFSSFDTTVFVTVSPHDDGVLIVVADEGPGISEEEIRDLFKPFQRATPRGTAGERSTGLGLAIAKRVVDGHGGRLWCESIIGKGSTFSAWLPAMPPVRSRT